MPKFDLSAHSPSADPTWRQRAVELAVEKHLIGQASYHTRTQTSDGVEFATITVVSASEPQDRYVRYSGESGEVLCDCPAGQYERPCSHAGAALLLVWGGANERPRDAEGSVRRANA